ncbi:alcohol dehydrogenase catalytic domain-containing protein [Streptomyces griseorubiginosus]|uniref:alcohol dehydrogenase catalytic domain-containing protein n=1 Tax=Streptomyces griseorubiginosus TaxID=67304 RepID=UPI0036E91CF6
MTFKAVLWNESGARVTELEPLPLHPRDVVGVEETGPAAQGVQVGDRVLMVGTANCGTCHFCRRGKFDQCARMVQFGPATARTRDGAEVHPLSGFAELAAVPDIQLVPVTTDLPADQLALISHPVCPGVGAELRTAPVEPGSAPPHQIP